MPAPAVIPAPVAYLEVAAVKTLVAGHGVLGGLTAGGVGGLTPASQPRLPLLDCPRRPLADNGAAEIDFDAGSPSGAGL